MECVAKEFLDLSQKELRQLCKNHGLPAKRSKNDMVKSLLDHSVHKKESAKQRTRNRGGNSAKPDGGEGCRRTVEATKRHTLASNEIVDIKDNNGPTTGQVPNAISTCSVDGAIKPFISSNIQDTVVLENQGLKVPHSHKEEKHQNISEVNLSSQNFLNPATVKINSENLQHVRSKEISGECSSESGLAYTTNTDRAAPTPVQFFVRSEEGINLCVDFNCKPPDWINSLNNEVTTYKKTQGHKSWSICDEIRDAELAHRNLQPSEQVDETYRMEVRIVESKLSPLTSGSTPIDLTGLHDEGNLVSSSCMNFSHAQTSNANADRRASLQNTEDTFSAVNKNNSLVHTVSSNNTGSNEHEDLTTTTNLPDSLKVSINDSFNSRTERNASSSGKHDGHHLPTDFVELEDGTRNKHVCADHAISPDRNQNLTLNGDQEKGSGAEEGCPQLSKCGKTRKRSLRSEVSEDYCSKREKIDQYRSEKRKSLSCTKNPPKDSTSNHKCLRRRSNRLLSKSVVV